MTKKRIFISMHYLELGGAEISLIGLLQALDYSKYDVDLLLHRHQGELMQFIPKEVNLLPEIVSYACIESPLTEAIRRGQFGVAWGRLKAKWRARQYQPKDASLPQCAVFQYIAQEVEPYLPSLEQFGNYDLAISFLQPHNYVLSKVRAKKKACWIHTDYTKVEFDVDAELPVWTAYDYVVSISPDVTKTFLQVFPTLSNKIVEIENILSSKFVRERAEETDVTNEMPKNEKTVNVLSVGRFSDAKNYDNVPDICRRVRENGIDLYWYIIGFGDETLIRQKIHEAGMEDYVIILGKRTNPYPYMKACDIYAQPSRYEGKSVTVREAQMLGKPVVVTNYATAKSQIQDRIDGVIVPMDNKGCAEGMSVFIRNEELQKDIVNYLHGHDYGNTDEAEKLYRII
jgi:glycosyltransferase involved in cell wall biosynthesis